MAEADSLEYETIYDGQNLPQGTSFLVTGLETGTRWSFKLYALNFNGKSEPTNIYTFNACTEPKGMQPPFKISSQANALVIGWTDPIDRGGCPITGYVVFRDDSAGGEVSIEVNEDNDPLIRNNPVLK